MASGSSTSRRRILEALAERGPATLAELVDAHRALAGRPRTGWRSRSRRTACVGRDERGRFRLGVRLAAWGAAAARRGRAGDAAGRCSRDLRDETGESAQLYVRDGDRRVCVAAAERPAGLRDTVPVGARLPLARRVGRQGAPRLGRPAGLARRAPTPRPSARSGSGAGRHRWRAGAGRGAA